MIDVSILPLFFTAIFFLVISPGPDLVLISTYSSTKGFQSGLMLSVGIFIAGVVQTLLVAFGFGQLMQVMPAFAYGVKIVGAVYLAWIGLKMLRSWYVDRQQAADLAQTEPLTDLNLVSKGLLNNLFNPKALLFFSLFLSQFTTINGSITAQIVVLGLILSTFAFTFNMMFAFAFAKLGSVIGDRFNVGRHIDGILGLIFLGLATRLATSK
ncbi:MAG: LysE family translocator [Anaerolineae bacterium]